MEGRVTAMRGLLSVCVLVAGGLAACGGGAAANRGGSGGSDVGSPDGGAASSSGSGGRVGPVGTASPWSDLPQAEIALIGGSAASSGGTAQAGGSVHVTSAGGIALDPSLSPPQTPAGPSGGMSISSSDLGSDLNASGGITVSGTVQSGGKDAVRKISASGDVVISGTLRGADLGGSRQGFDIEAPGHTVYVSGTIDTSGGSSANQSGGAVTIVADQVVVAGKLLSGGGGGSSPGAAGAISIKAAMAASLGGTIDASGGDASGGASTTGARGGDVTITGGGDLAVAGEVRTRGGAAVATGDSAQGGDAGKVSVDVAGMLTWSAALDGRGGPGSAKSGGGTVAGGAAGSLAIGQQTPPKAIAMLVPISVSGGSGNALGGDGGSAELDAKGGDQTIATGIDASGGDSAGKPGAGGAILVFPGSSSSTANMDISAKLTANGGSAPKGSPGDVNGGAGGLIKLIQQSLNGNTTTEPTAVVQANGGNSSGGGTAGAAGMVFVFTNDGNGTVHGQLQTRGGDAPDPGGTGGGGGLVYVFTGAGHDRMSGVLIIAPDGAVDSSGGNGTIGGSARNNGMGGVNLFPSNQNDEYDVEQIAVLINSDGVHGSDRGYIDNQGKVTARGGKANGSGGDVVYHGKQQDGNETPLPGDVENMGDGTGMAGDFAGE
jgi:hypothetical protein